MAKLTASLLALAATTSLIATAAFANPTEPRAFSRAERPGDRSAYVPGSPGDPVQVSRRVARYTDGRGRSTELFVAKTRQRVCIILETGGGAGAGCNPLSVGLFPKGTKLTITSGKHIAGIATDDVKRVVLIGTRGRRHVARLSPDNAFIHDCQAWNGCPGLVATINAYDAHGKLIDRVAGP